MDIREFTIDSLQKYNARIAPQLAKIPSGATLVQRLFNIPEQQVQDPREGDLTIYQLNGETYTKAYHNNSWENATVSDGKSAYEIWLDAGNQGTIEDFLASLQGDSGYQGAANELEVVNNLVEGGATAALSAEQGKVLDMKKIEVVPIIEGTEVIGTQGIADWVIQQIKGNVVDSLTVGGTQVALSAEQGKVLNNDLQEFKGRDILISESDFEYLEAQGLVDPTKRYFIYDDEE